MKKNRDPRWDEEFTFTLEEPPTNDRMHFEVVSTSSRMGLIHPKVQLITNKHIKKYDIYIYRYILSVIKGFFFLHPSLLLDDST